MQTITSSKARTEFKSTFEAATAAPVEVVRRDGETVVMLSKREYLELKKASLDAEIDYLIDRHAHTLKALADR
ncbi:type II toxin-antitoxin system Phd/YefM family antitoxin [Salmonella enterica]|nr:type II toxin-antitoxin system Phd/YefM family antitoxin [Salmonella enterica]